MRGKIFSREKCRDCGGEFVEVIELIGKRRSTDMKCPCGQRPRTLSIFLYLDKSVAPDLTAAERRVRISRNQDGYMLRSYAEALRIREAINKEIDDGTFRVANWLPDEIEQFRGKVLFWKWLKTREGKAPTTYQEEYRYCRYYFAGVQNERGEYVPGLEGFFHGKDMRRCNKGTIEDFLAWVPEQQQRLKQTVPEKDRARKFNRLSEKTQENILIILRIFFGWLYDREEIVRIPQFPQITPPDPVIRVQDLDDREKAIEALRPCHRPVFTFFADHPVREGELRALKVKNVNLKARTVHICEAFSKKEIRFRKSKRDYILPLSSRFDPAWIAGKHPEAFVFTNEHGRPYKPENLRRIWQRACLKAEVPYIPPQNASRHTTATRIMRESGGNRKVVSQALGHSSERMADKYAKWNVEILRGYIGPAAPVVDIDSKKKAKG